MRTWHWRLGLILAALLLLSVLWLFWIAPAHAQVLRVQTNGGTLTVASVLDCINGVLCTCSSTADGPECTIDGTNFEEEGQIGAVNVSGTPAADKVIVGGGSTTASWLSLADSDNFRCLQYDTTTDAFTAYAVPTPNPTPTSYVPVPKPTTLDATDCDAAAEVGRIVVDGDGLDAQTLYTCTDLAKCVGGANNGNTCGNASVCPGGTCTQFWCVAGTNDGASCGTSSAASSICPSGACVQYTYRRQALRLAVGAVVPGTRTEEIQTSSDFTMSQAAGSQGASTLALNSTVMHSQDVFAAGQVPTNLQPTPIVAEPPVAGCKYLGPNNEQCFGYSTQKYCLGGTGTATCTTNADCTGTCQGGANLGASCTAASVCPGGACSGALCQDFEIHDGKPVRLDDGLSLEVPLKVGSVEDALKNKTAAWSMRQSTDLGTISTFEPVLYNKSQDRTIQKICWFTNVTGATVALQRIGGNSATPVPSAPLPTPSGMATPGWSGTDAGCVTGLAVAWPKDSNIEAKFTTVSGITRSGVVVQYVLVP